MHKILCTLVVLFSVSISVNAQSDFRPGYYITWENDTIHGLVDYRGEIRNSRFCVFKENENAQEKKFMPDDIQAYRFTDSKFYISREVEIEDSTKQVFLEFLLNGITNLYYHKNINSFRYYIEDQTGKLLELENETETVYLEGKGTFVRPSNKHIGLLKLTFSDCNEIQNELNDIELSHSSLINITREYHDYVCTDKKCIIYEKKPELFQFDWSFYSGFGLSTISIDDAVLNEHFDNSIFPHAGIAFDLTLPRVNEKISLQISSDIGKNNFTGIYEQSMQLITRRFSVTIEHIPVCVNACLKYSYPKGKIRPVFLAGGGIVHMLNQQNTIQKDLFFNDNVETSYSTLYINNTIPGYNLSLGLNYVKNKKEKAYLKIGYRQFLGSTHNYYQNVTMKSAMVNLGYYLN